MKKNIKTAWATEEKIKELKAKIALRKADDAAFISSAEAITIKTDAQMNFMKDDIAKKRIQLAQCLNGDEQVITTALASSTLDRLTYQRSTADKCIVEKNQDVFDQVKKINCLKHTLNMKQQRIDELELTLRNLKNQEQPVKAVSSSTPYDDESEQRIRILSTKLDKVLLKINSARYVNTTYKRMLAYLEKDSLSLPGRLDNLENNLVLQQQELAELRVTAREARVACDMTRRQRTSLESEVMHDKSLRDKELTAIRKKLRQIQEEAETANMAGMYNKMKKDQKRNKDGEDGNSGSNSNFSSDRKQQKEALSFALEILKDTVGAGKVEDIAVNFDQQLRTQSELLNRAEELQKSKSELSAKLASAEDCLKTTRYDDSMMLSKNGNPEILRSEDHASLVKAKHLEEQISGIEVKVRTIADAIDLYYRKACIMNKDCFYDEAASLDQKIKTIMDVFQNLSKKFGDSLVVADSRYQVLDQPTTSPNDETQILNLLPSYNIRVDLPVDSEEDKTANSDKPNSSSTQVRNDKSLFNDEDDELETSYFSREDIKKKGEEILALSKPKKNKKGKK